jgi:hypothetical protein
VREQLLKTAPENARLNFKVVVASFDNDLTQWLSGPEADDPNPSDEYVAFAAVVMAANDL